MNDAVEKFLYWVRVAVGILFCFLMIRVFDRVGELLWQFKSAPVVGYGADGASEAVWVALREVVQALAAIGSAILIVGWSIFKSWWNKRWQKDKPADPVVPDVVPDENQKRKLLDLLKRLKERLT